MRPFCWTCHRPEAACFCELARPFASDPGFALVVHPDEAKSTVGTAWILRRSISNLRWYRGKGQGLEAEPSVFELLNDSKTVPLLLFPAKKALNLNQASEEEWRTLVPGARKPLFFVIDGTWTQARAMLRKSGFLRSLPRVSFETAKPSEYEFKTQPDPACLSCVEGVHRVIEVLAARGWCRLPPEREHDRMIEIFRRMVRFQLGQERRPRTDSRVRYAQCRPTTSTT